MEAKYEGGEYNRNFEKRWVKREMIDCKECELVKEMFNIIFQREITTKTVP